MSVNSELHIIAPGICGPLAEIQSLKNEQRLDQWIQLLSKAKISPSRSNANDVLSSIFNLQVDGDFPSAAFSMLADDRYDESKYYMHADPVHLQADMDHAILTSSEDLNITEYESSALCDALNQHFDQDGITFISLDESRWLVETENNIQMTTTPLSEAIGRNVNFILPEGVEAMRWKQLLTEAQMLMFSHVVNQNRDVKALQPINSLWFYGVGELPSNDDTQCHVSSLCSNQTMLEGLAKHVRCEHIGRPDSAGEYVKKLFDMSAGSVNVLHLPELEHLVNYTDVMVWTESLLELLEHWFYPLLKMAHNNNINVILYPCNNKRYHFSKNDYLRFWRRGKLEQHVHSYQRN